MSGKQWEVVPGHYPGFIEIKGAPFKISIVLQATDLSVTDAMERERCAEKIVKAMNHYDDLVAELRAIIAASPKTFELPLEEFVAWSRNRARSLLDKMGERHHA